MMFRIISLFFCTLLPLQCIGFLLFRSGANTISEQIEQASIIAIEHLGESVISEVDTLKNDLYNIESDSRLRSVAYMGDAMSSYRYYATIEELQNYLKILVTNNSLIENIFVYFPRSGNFFTASLSESTGYGTYDSEQISGLMESAVKAGSQRLIFDDSGIHMVILYPESCYYKEKSPTFVIDIRLSTASICSLLSSRNIGEQQSTALIDLGSGRMYFGNQNAAPVTVINEIWSQFPTDISDTSLLHGNYNANGATYFASVYTSEVLGISLLQIIPLDLAIQPLQTYERSVIIYIIVSLIVFVLYAVINLRIIRKPIQKLVKGFSEIEAGNYSVVLPTEGNVEEMAYLTDGFNQMAQKLNDTIDRLYKQEIYAQRMELNQLQMQINPHFLFNTYFMMDRLLQQGDYDTAEVLSGHLGKFFRYINRDARRCVELSMEWAHAHSYAMVQQLRYSRRLRIELEPVPVEFEQYIVPRLILQPVIENSIEHGLRSTVSDGLSRLSFQTDAQYLHIIVEDNGSDANEELVRALEGKLGSSDSPEQETTALINIHRRLQLYYGKDYGLRLSLSEFNGLKTEILLPIDGKSSEERKNCHENIESSDRG